MAGQMCWLPHCKTTGAMALYMRTEPHQAWAVYTSFPMLSAPDYNVPKGSKGWATYQKLMKCGWTLIPTAQAHQRVYSLVGK